MGDAERMGREDQRVREAGVMDERSLEKLERRLRDDETDDEREE